MFESIKGALCRLLKIPPEPNDPMGDVASLLVFRASRKYYYYKLLGWLLKSSAGILVALALTAFIAVQLAFAKPMGQQHSSWLSIELSLAAFLIVSGALFKTATSFFLVRLDYEMRWYKLSDRSLRIREGLLTVKEMTMTFANIQNISIDQGPIQRLFGIADLKVDSAGGGGGQGRAPSQQDSSSAPHVAYFRGVDNPNEILTLMRARLKRCQDSGLGHPEEALETHPGHSPSIQSGDPVDDASRIELYGELLKEAQGLRAALELAAKA